VSTLARAAKRACVVGDNTVAADALEIAVARSYDLDRNSMISLLENFPKIDGENYDRLTGLKMWSE